MPDRDKIHHGTIVLAAPDSTEVEAAQRWLLTAEGAIPDLSALAQTVYAYDRIGDWDKINGWLEDGIKTPSAAGASSFRNQELLDFLFLMVAQGSLLRKSAWGL
jgi:hypothetical protein